VPVLRRAVLDAERRPRDAVRPRLAPLVLPRDEFARPLDEPPRPPDELPRPPLERCPRACRVVLPPERFAMTRYLRARCGCKFSAHDAVHGAERVLASRHQRS
jgi:hypothetical protein